MTETVLGHGYEAEGDAEFGVGADPVNVAEFGIGDEI